MYFQMLIAITSVIPIKCAHFPTSLLILQIMKAMILILIAMAIASSEAADNCVAMDDFVSYYNEDVFPETNVKFGITGDSTVQLSGGLVLAAEIPDDAEISANISSKAGNTFPDQVDASYNVEFCELLTKPFFPKQLTEKSNFPETCPYESQSYEINNFEMTWNDVGKLLPPGSSNTKKLCYYLQSKSIGFISTACVVFTITPCNASKGPM